MNTLQKTLIALATGSLMSVSAQAAISYGSGMAAQPYLGAKIGQYSPDAEGVDDAISYGIYGGVKLTPNFGLEAEYLTTSDADSYEDAISKEEYSADVYGLYGTANYAFPSTGGLYAKGRLGFAKNEIDVEEKFKDINASDKVTVSDSGLAGGLGLGYNISPNASIEGMYNWYPTLEGDDDTNDLDVSGLTLGAHFKF